MAEVEAALAGRWEASAVVGAFERMVRRRADAVERQRAVAVRKEVEEARLAAVVELGGKVEAIKRQLVEEKAEAEVAIAQRDRLIERLQRAGGGA